MGHPSRRFAAVVTAAATTGAVAIALATGAPAQAAQSAPAATSTYCPTSTTIVLLPAGTGYLFPNLLTTVSACGFVDNGAPYHFTIGTATSHAQTPTGPRTYVVTNLSTVCSTVTVNGNSLFATGCSPA
ncbi:hypothetical protein ACH4Y0_38025 [Streptomyces sp. NPDC020707]|uniref:hypothetical protein n=1 Tax=Streptomyces sp. NPDC020707 TaxID=3365084 RepID=UPI00378E33F6